jgi:hypothetical protein
VLDHPLLGGEPFHRLVIRQPVVAGVQGIEAATVAFKIERSDATLDSPDRTVAGPATSTRAQRAACI